MSKIRARHGSACDGGPALSSNPSIPQLQPPDTCLNRTSYQLPGSWNWNWNYQCDYSSMPKHHAHLTCTSSQHILTAHPHQPNIACNLEQCTRLAAPMYYLNLPDAQAHLHPALHVEED